MITLNGQPLSVTIFPDNTSQVWKLPQSTFESNKAHVTWEYRTEAECMQLFQLLDLLETKGIRTYLTMTYLPYARQDKPISNESTFALNTFWKLFNTFNYVEELIVHDPHNFDAVRPRCKVRALYPAAQVERIAQEMGGDTIFCYPDAGALKKYSEVYKLSFRDHVYGEKVRDQLTGNILSYKLVGDVAGKNVLIVDDICDGGMTFKMLAKDLLAAGAKEVNLFVTHGIFSKGVRTLLESGIKRVFTQDGEKGPRSQTVQL